MGWSLTARTTSRPTRRKRPAPSNGRSGRERFAGSPRQGAFRATAEILPSSGLKLGPVVTAGFLAFTLWLTEEGAQEISVATQTAAGAVVEEGMTVALIRDFYEAPSDRASIHGPVSCGWKVVEANGTRVLQLDTYGSKERQLPGKVSQAIQLDHDGARALLGIIRHVFPDLY